MKLLSHSATSPPRPKPSHAPNCSSAALTHREKGKKRAQQGTFGAALAMRGWMQRRVVPSVWSGPASSLQTDRRRETEREGREGAERG